MLRFDRREIDMASIGARTLSIIALVGITMLFALSMWQISLLVDRPLLKTSLSMNSVLVLIIIGLCIFAIHINRIYRNQNMVSKRVLKVIDRITHLKLSVFTKEELVELICQELAEYFGAKFWLILTENNNENPWVLFPEGRNDFEYQDTYRKRVLDHSKASSIIKGRKTIYYKPILIGKKKIGLLIAEVDLDRDFSYPMTILPEQISIIINNFESRLKLNEATISQEKESLRSLILSSISHDLKTPLSLIIGSLSIFTEMNDKDHLNKDNAKTLIKTALDEAQRLKSFIIDVLEMTRIESGAVKLQKQPISWGLVFKKTIKRFEDKLKDFDLDISLSNTSRVEFDVISAEQIAQNLIDNAVKYSRKHSKISIFDKVENNIYYILLQNEGEDVKPEKLGMMFNKFERFDMKDKMVGSGLGLSIVKALMEINNACISVKSSPCGKGVIFTLEFRDFKEEGSEIYSKS